MEVFKSYRILYLISFILITILVFIALYANVQSNNPPTTLNIISIIGSALTLFGIIITIGEIYGINSISKLTKIAAEKAVLEVEITSIKIKQIELLNNIELLKTNLFKGEIGNVWIYLDAINRTFVQIMKVEEKLNPNSNSNISIDTLEKWKNIIEVKLSSKSKQLSEKDKKSFLSDLNKLTKILNY